MVFVLALRLFRRMFLKPSYRILMETKNYIMRGNCWQDTILMATYIQQYVDTVIGSENDGDQRGVVGEFPN